MAVRLELVAEKQTTRDLEHSRPAKVGSGWMGAGLVVLAAGLAFGTYLMIDVVSNVPGTLRGQWECWPLERNAAVWTACLSKFDPRMRVNGIAESEFTIRE
jgi:hypothetical protein